MALALERIIVDKYIYQAFLTLDEDGRYLVEFPDLPGCFSEGETFTEAAAMGADAAKSYVASLLAHQDTVPEPQRHACPEGSESVLIFFETDPSYLITGDVISAAEAARRLSLSAGRVSHMINAGILDGYRQGRRTWVSEKSVEARLQETVRAGRPRYRAEA